MSRTMRGILAGMLLGVATTLYMIRPVPPARSRRDGRLWARVRRAPATARAVTTAASGWARAVDAGRAGLAQLRQMVR
ncbi:MAG TPA: hypothetical protein VIL08_05345 [Limnochorda sp.]